MSEFKYFVNEEMKAGKHYVTVKVNYQADDTAVRTISYSKPAFLPPITASDVNGKHSFSYDIAAENYIKATELSKEMTPIEFLTFMKNLTTIILEVDDYFMTQRNLLLTEDYVYIKPDNFSVRVIYMPFADAFFEIEDINKQVYELSRRFSRSTTDEWNQIILRMWALSEKTPVYDANSLFSTLLTEFKSPANRDKSIPPKAPVAVAKPATPGFPSPTPPRPAPPARVSGSGKTSSQNTPKDKPKSILGGLFGDVFGKKKDTPLDDDLFDMTMTDDSNDMTMIDDMALPNAMLQLFDGNNVVANIPIIKWQFFLGRNREAVDYCFDGEEDRGIGRVHALITFQDGHYYITDQTSTNGTFINNTRLEPNSPTLLSDGDIIKLHRKELKFVIG